MGIDQWVERFINRFNCREARVGRVASRVGIRIASFLGGGREKCETETAKAPAWWMRARKSRMWRRCREFVVLFVRLLVSVPTTPPGFIIGERRNRAFLPIRLSKD